MLPTITRAVLFFSIMLSTACKKEADTVEVTYSGDCYNCYVAFKDPNVGWVRQWHKGTFELNGPDTLFTNKQWESTVTVPDGSELELLMLTYEPDTTISSHADIRLDDRIVRSAECGRYCSMVRLSYR